MCFSFLPQLDESKDFEERKMIRAAMRDLRKKKRGNGNHMNVYAINVFIVIALFLSLNTHHYNQA